MVSRYERDVHLFYLSSSTYPPTAPDVKIGDMIDLIEANWKDKQSVAYLDARGGMHTETALKSSKGFTPGNAIFIADFKRDDKSKTVTLLLTRGDPNASHPAYIKVGEDRIRYARPNSDEVQGFSAHLILSLQARPSERGRCRAVLERIPVASKTAISLYLAWLIKRIAERTPEFTFTVQRKKNSPEETKSYAPLLRLHDRASRTLRQDLETGEVASIELIKTEKFLTGSDTSEIIRSEEKSRRIYIKSGTGRDKVEDFLKGVFKERIDEGYDEVVIQLRNLPGEKTKTVRFDEEVKDAMDVLYTRITTIEVKKGADHCHTSINRNIESPLLGELGSTKNWS